MARQENGDQRVEARQGGEQMSEAEIDYNIMGTFPAILAEVVNGKNIWSLSYTSEQGRYSFSHLPPGRVSDLGGAKVILINKDQEPQEYNFHLPVFLFRAVRDQ